MARREAPRKKQEASLLQDLRATFLDQEHLLIDALTILTKPTGSSADDTPVFKRIDQIGLWDEQKQIIDAILNGEKLLILKSRQIGSTTAILMAMFVFWFLSDKPEQIVIMAHTLTLAQKKLQVFKLMYDRLPDYVKERRPLERCTQDELKLADSGATIYANGFTQDGGLRGTTCNRMLLTEFTLSKDADDLLAKSLAALGRGQMIIECTAQFNGDAMAREIQKNQDGKTSYRFMFFPWFDHHEYRDTATFSWADLDNEESKLAADYDLSLEQLAWRRTTMGTYTSKRDFQREYPSSVEEAYASLPNSFAEPRDLAMLTVLDSRPDQVVRYQKPREGTRYVIGFDPAMGKGKDYTSIHVLDARSFDVVASFHSNTTKLEKAYDIVGLLSNEYGVGSPQRKAVVNVEINIESVGTELELGRMSVPIMHHDGKPGWHTNGKTKPILLRRLQGALSKHQLKSIDSFTLNEISQVTLGGFGKLEIPKTMASHFDGGISLALAIIAADSVVFSTVPDFRSTFDPHGKNNPFVTKRARF